MPPRTPKPITRKNLRKSRKACHRLEDEVNARLAALNLTANSPAHLLRRALLTIQERPPSWCEADAWRWKLSFALSYLDTYDNLVTYERLRNLKERKVVQPREQDNEDSYMPALVEVESYKQKAMDDDESSDD